MLRGNNNRNGGLSKREQLFEAVQNNDAAKLRSLITIDKVSVNLRMGDHLDTVLHAAVRLGHIDIINVLLVYGADPKIENLEKTASGEQRYTPIKLARVLNKDNVLAEMARTITSNTTVNPEDMEILQQFRSVNSRPFQPQQQQPSQPVSRIDVFRAIQDGNINDVKSWLLNGGDVTQKNAQGQTPLSFARMIESFDLITEISQTLPPNLPLNTEDIQLVNLFRQVNYVPGVAREPMLVSNLAAIPSRVAAVQNPPQQHQSTQNQSAAKTMYIQALEAERLDILEACLKSTSPNIFIDMNSRDVGLHVAVKKKNPAMIALLLSSRARLNIENAAGMNPLQLAISTGAWECVWTIINNYNYDLNGDAVHFINQFISDTQKSTDQQNRANGNDSVTIIQAATSGDYYRLVSLMPKDEALFSYLLDADGNTLLHWAAAQGNCEVIKLILAGAVDLNITNKDGNTPLELAVINKQTEVLKLFSAYINANPDVLRGNKVDAEILASALAVAAPAQAPAGQEVAPMDISPAQPQKSPREFYLDAVASGDVAAIQTALVHVSADLCVDAKLNTGLHLAVKANNPDLAKIFLQAKASINAKNTDGVTPVQLAMREGKWDIIKAIAANMNQKDNGIANTADAAAMYIANDYHFINATNLTPSNMYTAELYIMSLVKNYASLNRYVVAALRPNYITIPVDKELNTVLHLAVQKNDEEMLRTLLSSCEVGTFTANKAGLTPLQLALRDNKWNMVQLLLRYCNDKNDIRAIFIAAVLANKVDIVRILLQKTDNLSLLNFSINLRVDNKLNTALHYAVTKNMSDMMELLLGKRALISVVNSDQKSPLDLALENNAWDCIKMLVQRSRINPNEPQFKSAFIRSVAAGRMDVADIFLNGGIDPDTLLDNDENTCLHTAIQKKDESFVVKLLGFGASPFKKNKNGKSAFELAVEANEWNLACLCIRGCSRDLRDMQQIRAVFGIAVTRNNWQVVETMINAGVDVNTVLDDRGNTAMHYAMLNNFSELVAALIRKNANVTVQNTKKQSPVMIGIGVKGWAALKTLVDKSPEGVRPQLYLEGLLLLAMRDWQLELVESLLKTGVNPTAYINGDSKTTYLHKAVEMKCTMLIRALVKAYYIREQKNGREQTNILEQPNNDGLNPVQLAIRNQDWDSVQAIMESSPQGARVDTRILDTAMSEALRAKEYSKVLRLITVGASAQFFATQEGKTLFQTEILPNKHCHEMLVSLIFAKKKCPEIRDLIANKYETNSMGILEKKPRALHQKIADSVLLVDAVLLDEIPLSETPVITPQGATFAKSSMHQAGYKCPITRTQFREHEIIKNDIYFDLLLYYKLPHVDVTVLPPALIKPESNTPFVKPVVAQDGLTYEKDDLINYMREHEWMTPTGTRQQFSFDQDKYLNRQAIDLIQLSKTMLKAKTEAMDKVKAEEANKVKEAVTAAKPVKPAIEDIFDTEAERAKLAADAKNRILAEQKKRTSSFAQAAGVDDPEKKSSEQPTVRNQSRMS